MGMRHSSTLPFGAWRILEARKKGMKPADMILVSLVGKLEDEVNPVVQALPGISHDWSWAKGLKVCFWSTPQEYDPRHIIDCFKARPEEVYLWNAASQKGYFLSYLPTPESIDRPQDQWEWKIDADRWLPFQEKAFIEGGYPWN